MFQETHHKPTLLFALLILISSCVPAVKEDLTDINIDFSDSTQISILQYQDLQKTDSLISYLDHEDATMRYLAARAFSSYEDDEAVRSLQELISDPVSAVAQQAIFSLGQMGASSAMAPLIQNFAAQDSANPDLEKMAVILETVGKVGSKEVLEQIASVSTYLPSDTTLVNGQLWSIYRFALRDIYATEGTQRAIEVITGNVYPLSSKIIASHYLARAKGIDLTSHSAIINNALLQAKDAQLAMNLAKASKKCNTKTNLSTLIDYYGQANDPRLKINIINSLAAKGFSPSTHELFLKSTTDKDPLVSMTAAQALQIAGSSEVANDYKKMARDTSLPARTRTALYEAAHVNLPFYYSISKGAINRDLLYWFKQEKDQYIQGNILTSLAADPSNQAFVLSQLEHIHPFVRTTSASLLRKILEHPEFDIVLAPAWRRTQFQWLKKIKTVLKNGDSGLIAELAPIYNQKRINDVKEEELDFLDTVLLKLSLPEHTETYDILAKTLTDLGRSVKVKKAPTFLGHPPSWEKLANIDDSTRVRIETSKGTITLKLFPEEAPATVLNFLDLVDRGYYNGKNFHRVVPNFVIQGGCPRGDGYGSLNYNIRSEFTTHTTYRNEGCVGMASAGRHTESTQWFVTHSAAPHLDGRYTLFAQVEKGMDVVNNIIQNDIIKEVKIIRI